MKLLLLATLATVCLASPQYTPYQHYRNSYNGGYNPQYRASPYQGGYRSRSGLEANAAILRSDSQVNQNGYNYAYETENGIQAQESGVENNGIQAQGSYSYTGDDGQVYTVRYTADANGFQPQGAHLPTPPPVPEAIARSLYDGQYNSGRYNSPSIAAARYNPFGRSRGYY